MSEILRDAYDAYHEDRGHPRDERTATLLQRIHWRLGRFDYPRAQGTRDYLRRVGARGRLVDLGCGDGELLHSLSGQFKQMYGMEFSAVGVARARARLSSVSNVQLCHVDIEKEIPSLSGIDWVVALDTLEHLVAPHLAIAKANRMMRVGGRFVVSVPNVAFLPNRFRMLAGRVPVTGSWGGAWDSFHLHYFNHGLVAMLFEQLGFHRISYMPLGILPSSRRLKLSLLCGEVFGVFEKVADCGDGTEVAFDPNR